MTAHAEEKADEAAMWGDMPVPPVDQLTGEPEKAVRYGADPLVREGWATLVGVLGPDEALRFACETGLLWLRPDVAAAGAAGEVIERVAGARFVPVGACAVRLDRGGVRALWWWQLTRATAERLLLLDAVAALGPGLLVLYRHPQGDPAVRLTRLKGGNDPAGRPRDSLRSVAGSPNRLLTMVHTSDDPLDVVRELAVFLTWQERAELVASAWASGPGGSSVIETPLAAVRSAYPGCPPAPPGARRVPGWRGEAFAALVRDIAVPQTPQRWAAVRDWSRRAPLLNDGSGR
ncbi:nucleoside-diphosphate kinase [Streptomyces sp. AM 4-1-1]|uniref:nucleoside-diphosphate kinase n=1 Tax=Streptomyces sp. AM 4-1-1 TaxID=3028710 RepID=UPI0023B8A524|nr:nucleoside-diphosphate kinase [Streptomyces sp. AM 4-1-1]WEH31984.1 nucleoside-diphosphate kinase [Streptomyces sp. AM 4-1-1]